jgi:hypothetical protein
LALKARRQGIETQNAPAQLLRFKTRYGNGAAAGDRSKADLPRYTWTMREFSAGSGLTSYGLKGTFSPIVRAT